MPSELNALVDEVIRFRSDPVYMVRSLWGVGPTDQQKQLLTAVAQPGAKVTVKSGHGTGKSTSLAWLVLWGLICFDDVKIPCTAPTSHQLQDVLWAEIAKWHMRMPDWFREQIEIKADSVGRPSRRGVD